MVPVDISHGSDLAGCTCMVTFGRSPVPGCQMSVPPWASWCGPALFQRSLNDKSCGPMLKQGGLTPGNPSPGTDTFPSFPTFCGPCSRWFFRRSPAGLSPVTQG